MLTGQVFGIVPSAEQLNVIGTIQTQAPTEAQNPTISQRATDDPIAATQEQPTSEALAAETHETLTPATPTTADMPPSIDTTNSPFEIASFVGNSLTGIGTIGLAFAAFLALGQWKKQLQYQAKFELARQIALLAFEFKEGFHHVRHLVYYPHETADRPRPEDENPDDRAELDTHYVRVRRLEHLRKIMRQLEAANMEAQVVLEDDLREFLDEYGADVKKVIQAVELIYGSLSSMELTEERRTQQMLIVYSSGDDDLAKSVEGTTEQIMNWLKNHLK